MVETFENLLALSEENKQWYFATYPFLKGLDFPLSAEFLQAYYQRDMENRNLRPLKAFFNNYDFLWSYFLQNFPKDRNEKFVAPDWFGSLLRAFPLAIKKTGEDIEGAASGIGDFFNSISMVVIVVLILIAIIFISKS